MQVEPGTARLVRWHTLTNWASGRSTCSALNVTQAVLLLFPITENYEKYRKAQDAEVERDSVPDVQDII